MGRRSLVVVAVLVGVAAGPAPALAHQEPAGCLANGIDLTLAETSTLVRQGDTLTFLIGIQNTNSLIGLPCNGFAFRQVGRFDWVVNLNPRVEFGAAQATVSGTLHITDPDQDFAGIVKDLSFTVTNPSLTIDKTGSTTGGQAPQSVTYTYVVTNTSQTPVPMNQVGVQDDLCATPAYASGDNGDGLLSNSEQWTFTCAALYSAAGTFTNTAKACAMSTVDKRPVCSPPDTWTVVVTSPPPSPPPGPAPAPPQVTVKSANSTQEQCTLATPKGLTVRARELTTVKVTAKNVPAKTPVKVTLPGGKTLTARTNAKGVATFRLRPTKSGTASIKAAACSDVEKLAVRAARQTESKALPQVTG
jgi:uncharacterized repeat protein (TIGR01451 family)